MTKYEIPVYLFTGFLDGGKTSYIQKALQDPEFCGRERILLLVCEEGAEDFDKTRFCSEQITIDVLTDEETVSRQTLETLVETHQPDKVLIEYNGMWHLKRLKEAMPKNWTIYQEFFLVDSSSFLMYNANMRQLVYEKLKDCSCVLFNRFEKSRIDRMGLHKVVRAANTRCYIFYEDFNGRTEVDTIQDPLPFDLDAAVVEIRDEHFALWYRDLCETPGKYQGKIVSWKGFVESTDADAGQFVLGRDIMFCCMDDLLFGAFVCRWSGEQPLKKTWAAITAEVLECSGDVVFAVRTLQAADAPEHAVATF